MAKVQPKRLLVETGLWYLWKGIQVMGKVVLPQAKGAVRMFARGVEYEIKNAAKIAEERERKCMHCHRRHHKPAMERHYLKNHKKNFTRVKCKLCRIGHREEMLKDHIREHNVYIGGTYYIEPEELEELLNTGNHDATLTILGEDKEKQREFDRQYFDSVRLTCRGSMY